jgi:hypothetical protein
MSTHSGHGSVRSVRGNLAYERVPRLITTSATEENNILAYETTSSPLVVVYSPPASSHSSLEEESNLPIKNKLDDEVDSVDLGQEGAGSMLEPSLTPLRVVYSPTVSRSPSIGRESHRRHSIVREPNSENSDPEQMLPPADLSSPTHSSDTPFLALSENQVHRRRNSAASNTSARVPTLSPPAPSVRGPSIDGGSPVERSSPREEGDHLPPPVFVAFLERKWLQKIIVAKVALGIVSCCVLGNFIYA